MGSIANHILNLSPPIALFLVFLFPALEASIFVGFIFPGETAVILGGVLASQHKVPLLLAIAVAGAGAVLGDSVGYFVGKKWGHKILERASGRLLKPSRIKKAVEFVSKRGGPGVVIGRYTTVLRVLVPGAAGMAEMPYPKFLTYNFIGGVTWAALFTELGYLAGKSFAKVEKTSGTIGLVVFGVVVLILVIFGLVKYFREFKKERPESGEPTIS